MGRRNFRDGSGTTWDVWEVLPTQLLAHEPERREGPDRRGTPAPDTDPPVERRHLARRVADVPLFQHGWLAFRSESERRRLSPIPANWTQADLDDLCRYVAEASPVTTRET